MQGPVPAGRCLEAAPRRSRCAAAGYSWDRPAAPIRTTSSESSRATTAAPIIPTWRGAAAAARRHVGRRGIERRSIMEPHRRRTARRLPDALRTPLRRLLFSGELLDAAEPLLAGCRRLHLEMRGADRVVLLSKPWWCGRTVRRAQTQEPYTRLKFAFRYRKEYVNGFSCKTAEYVPPEGTLDKKAEATTPRSSEFPGAVPRGPAPQRSRPDRQPFNRSPCLTLSRPAPNRTIRVAGRHRPSRSNSLRSHSLILP